MHYQQINTHPFNGPFSGTTRVSRYQKGKTNLDFTEARDSEWRWHQLGHMQVCTLLQTDNHASNPPLSFFTGRMPFLLPNQQCQSTEGITSKLTIALLLFQTFHCRLYWLFLKNLTIMVCFSCQIYGQVCCWKRCHILAASATTNEGGLMSGMCQSP